MLGDAERDARTVGHDGLDGAVGGVRHVVELRDVDPAADREAAQQLVAAAGLALGLPLAHDLGDRQHDLLAVAEHGGVDEVGDRLGVEGGVAAGEHDRVVVGAIGRVQRDAGEVERVEHVGVAELGGEAQAEDVEGADRAVLVDGELRDRPVLAHHRFHVGPHGVGALGDDPVALVEDLVEDLDALVGQADLVGVGIHQRPADGGLVRPQSQSLRVELSSPPTYWIGFCTDGSRDSSWGKTDAGETAMDTREHLEDWQGRSNRQGYAAMRGMRSFAKP